MFRIQLKLEFRTWSCSEITYVLSSACFGTGLLNSTYNPSPPPPRPRYKHTQNPLRNCISPGLITGILRYSRHDRQGGGLVCFLGMALHCYVTKITFHEQKNSHFTIHSGRKTVFGSRKRNVCYPLSQKGSRRLFLESYVADREPIKKRYLIETLNTDNSNI